MDLRGKAHVTELDDSYFSCEGVTEFSELFHWSGSPWYVSCCVRVWVCVCVCLCAHALHSGGPGDREILQSVAAGSAAEWQRGRGLLTRAVVWRVCVRVRVFVYVSIQSQGPEVCYEGHSATASAAEQLLRHRWMQDRGRER